VCFGYLTFEQPEFHELFADRLLKRYNWRVSPDAVVLIPGVIRGSTWPAACWPRRATA